LNKGRLRRELWLSFGGKGGGKDCDTILVEERGGAIAPLG